MSSCGDQDSPEPAFSSCLSEVESRSCAGQLASGDPLTTWSTAASNRPVVVYVDLSGSMRGFLDPAYPTGPTNYSSVIDGLIVGLSAEDAYGYGSTLRSVPATLGTLGDREFYTDSNTEMEEALTRIATDTTLDRSHVVVGDGRRGDPDAANAQFSAMRSLAQQWIGKGGSFAVAASLAPFTPVEDDPAGCQDSAGAGGERRSCPLYAFAFIAPGDEFRVTSALGLVFEHLYAWPVPAIHPGGLSLRAPAGSAAITLNPQWILAPDSTRVARAGAAEYVNEPLVTEIVMPDSQSARGRLEHAILRGNEVTIDLMTRPLSLPPQNWSPVQPAGSLVRPGEGETSRIEILSHGATAPRHLYRIELEPSGTPSWLDQFDAADASDELRTFGLNLLFTSWRQDAERDAANPIGRLYVVVN